jgi:TonB family protein
MLSRLGLIIAVCLAGLCAPKSALPQKEAGNGNIVPPQIQSTSTDLSDFEVKLSGGEFLVRHRASKWKRSSTLNEPIAVGLIDGTQKIYIGTKAIRPPKAIHLQEPDYPESKRRSRIEGQVSLHLVVDDRGVVRFPMVDASAGPEFSNAAIEAVKKWSFQPVKLDGVPIAVLIHVTTDFRLY